MTANWFGGRLMVLGAALAVSAPLTFSAAEAARAKSGHYGSAHHARAIQAGIYAARSHGYRSVRYYGGGLQCVPFARENTGIELSGNANTWWNGAEGVYERGAKPEVGSVLAFRATGHMRLGHVAVVSNVVNSRTIEIDHANWGRGRINRNMTVVDVSPANDWTDVRVGLPTGDLGSVYPTYGFIYDRPDKGTMVANTGVTPSAPTTASASAATATEAEEVAEAADDDAVAPRSSSHHRYAARHGHSHAGVRFARAESRYSSRGVSVIRASAHFAPAKPHGRRHRS
jgi:surface antigen